MRINDYLNEINNKVERTEEDDIRFRLDVEKGLEQRRDRTGGSVGPSSITPVGQMKAIDAIKTVTSKLAEPDSQRPVDRDILKIMFDSSDGGTSLVLEALDGKKDENGVRYADYDYYYDEFGQKLQPQTLEYGPFKIKLPVETEDGWRQVRELEEFKRQQDVLVGGRQAELEAIGGYELVNQEVIAAQNDPHLQLENKLRYEEQQRLAQKAYQKLEEEMRCLGEQYKQEYNETQVKEELADNIGSMMISLDDIFEDRDPGDYVSKMMMTGVSPAEMYYMLCEDEVVKINALIAYFHGTVPHDRVHLIDERLDHPENQLTEEQWTSLEHVYDVCCKLTERDNDVWPRLTAEQQADIEDEKISIEDSFYLSNLAKSAWVARMRNWNVVMAPVRMLLESEGKLKTNTPIMGQNLGGNEMAVEKVILNGTINNGTNMTAPRVYAQAPTLNVQPQMVQPQIIQPQIVQPQMQVQQPVAPQPIQLVQQPQVVQQPQLVQPQIIQPQVVQQPQPVRLVQQPVAPQPIQLVQQPQQVVQPQIIQPQMVQQPQVVQQVQQPVAPQAPVARPVVGLTAGLNRVNWQQMEELLNVLWNNRQFVGTMSDTTYTTAWKDCCSAVHKKDATGLADIIRGLQVMTQQDGSVRFIDPTIFTRMLGELNPHVPTDGIKYSTDYSVYRNIMVQQPVQQVNTVGVNTYPNVNTTMPRIQPAVVTQMNATQYTGGYGGVVQYQVQPPVVNNVNMNPAPRPTAPTPPSATYATPTVQQVQTGGQNQNMVTLSNGIQVPNRV